jgi:hypothetical protein
MDLITDTIYATTGLIAMFLVVWVYQLLFYMQCMK